MGVDTKNWTVDNYLSAAQQVGLSPANFVPTNLRSQCKSVAANSIPPGGPATFAVACEASLIVRGIVYFKSAPGDCGSPTSVDFSDAQITGSIGQVAGGIAAMAGASLPGIGQAVQLVQQIFAHHDVAVANEQATICKVANIINTVIPYYDAQVRAGRISPSTAYAGMQSYLNQVNTGLASIEKTCNAACVYQAILSAHAKFVEQYWPQIAPASVATHAPGAPPIAITAPGGVIAVGSVGSGGIPVVPQTTLSGGIGGGFKVTSEELIFGGLILLVLIVVLLAAKSAPVAVAA